MIRPPIKELAISLPFQIDDFGNVASATAQEKIWADRARSAIGTALGERVMRPTYGTTMPVNLFNDTDAMREVIEEQVILVFERDLPLLEFQDLYVSVDEIEGMLSVEIEYALPNEEVTSVNIGIAYLNANQPIEQELL